VPCSARVQRRWPDRGGFVIDVERRRGREVLSNSSQTSLAACPTTPQFIPLLSTCRRPSYGVTQPSIPGRRPQRTSQPCAAHFLARRRPGTVLAMELCSRRYSLSHVQLPPSLQEPSLPNPTSNTSHLPRYASCAQGTKRPRDHMPPHRLRPRASRVTMAHYLHSGYSALQEPFRKQGRERRRLRKFQNPTKMR
jgi:hypothetical protein